MIRKTLSSALLAAGVVAAAGCAGNPEEEMTATPAVRDTAIAQADTVSDDMQRDTVAYQPQRDSAMIREQRDTSAYQMQRDTSYQAAPDTAANQMPDAAAPQIPNAAADTMHADPMHADSMHADSMHADSAHAGPMGDQTIQLQSIGNADASGTVTVRKLGDEAVQVALQLSGAAVTGRGYAALHSGTCENPGAEVEALQEASAGATTLSTLQLPMSDLMAGNHVVVVHSGPTSDTPPVACAAIGSGGMQH
ncbi:MAG: hypothetical protein M3Y31_03320 [Gemmatimonadota bacterium]|nr:hypothetical protein [Gemmatimonadota bacterium]